MYLELTTDGCTTYVKGWLTWQGEMQVYGRTLCLNGRHTGIWKDYLPDRMKCRYVARLHDLPTYLPICLTGRDAGMRQDCLPDRPRL